MINILAGLDTEYGLLVEGRGAEDQIEDATALVQSYLDEGVFVGWDYRHESPRADLRGFQLDSLAHDPLDARFDEGRVRATDRELRADRILPNGARFYNDHGHPEYATPECWGLRELAWRDREGDRVALRAAQAFAKSSGRVVTLYKNNTDFHGASYGAHESYLVPRSLGFAALRDAVMPMLIVRQVLCGAGKVGAETGKACAYQLSQRADFFVEAVNAETLFRRPVFNTRDEPHADPRDWIRLHVISGDATMIAAAVERKVGLVKLAIMLAIEGRAPQWDIARPPEAFQAISRDETYTFPIELTHDRQTDAYEILESHFSAAESHLELDEELRGVIARSRELLGLLHSDFRTFAHGVDWAAKRRVLESTELDWRDPAMRSYDLEYSNIDPDQGLFWALQTMGEVEADPDNPGPPTSRALARGLAVSKFPVKTACWRSVTFLTGEGDLEVELPVTKRFSADLAEIEDLETFIASIRA